VSADEQHDETVPGPAAIRNFAKRFVPSLPDRLVALSATLLAFVRPSR
jgi:hypothetical protein